MKKNRFIELIALSLIASTCCWANSDKPLENLEEIEPVKAALQLAPDLSQVSKAFGHVIGKNLTLVGIEFDVTQVLQGIQESVEGKAAPLSEDACIAAITKIQETKFQATAAVNLEKANLFMEKNSQQSGIVEIEKNKVQYKIEKKGDGLVVKQDSTPLVRYTGKFIDGKIFTTSTEEERVSLQETMAGFAKGIEGMCEGEKRTLYIHPDRAFGESGYLAEPNAALIFDIEVIKADAPEESDLSSATEALLDSESMLDTPIVH
ncbi:peptidylprolyl isomerase [Candidatus Aerophobetes bacterium]|uniref:Peptidyl-prolyl cis-trans isomerase n=1 Tax=Aerophobetes bacterium TaxID=2030807 RepID=A0A2A4X114_UNCAE|nr:MAG: peptidylprolyl isomerase [Candidatus Aerophobetes bacterium]